MQVIEASYQQNFKLSPLGFLRAGFFGKADREAWLEDYSATTNVSIFDLTSELFVLNFFYFGQGYWNFQTLSGFNITTVYNLGSGSWTFN